MAYKFNVFTGTFDNTGATTSGDITNNYYNEFQIDQTGGTSDTHGVLSGSVNGTNKVFTVSNGSYLTGSLSVYLNGQQLTQGSSEDWVETDPTSGTFTFASAPQSSDDVTAKYIISNSNLLSNLDMIVVRQASDLDDYLVSGEYVLPNKTIMIDGTVNIGSNSIRISEGTVLRGLSKGTIVSTATTGAVVATNVGSDVIIREVNVVCTTGPCFVLEGTIDYQLNMFFVGMIGATAAEITGFNVQAIKQCYIEADEGLIFKGTTRKVFVSETPFYGVTGSAITLDSTLDAAVADIVTSFFKFDSPGVGVTAETGYTVDEGKFRGSLIDGTATPISGLAPSDTNWFMTDNSGVRDSRYAGGLYLTSEATTTISTIDTPVKVAGTTSGLNNNERFTATNNRLTYNGLPPELVSVTGSFAVDTGNNVNLSFYIAKNGTVLTESRTRLRVGSGTDERTGSIATLVELETNDYIELWVENNDGTDNVLCKTLTLNGKS